MSDTITFDVTHLLINHLIFACVIGWLGLCYKVDQIGFARAKS